MFLFYLFLILFFYCIWSYFFYFIWLPYTKPAVAAAAVFAAVAKWGDMYL
jgi:hypothetical protein